MGNVGVWMDLVDVNVINASLTIGEIQMLSVTVCTFYIYMSFSSVC